MITRKIVVLFAVLTLLLGVQLPFVTAQRGGQISPELMALADAGRGTATARSAQTVGVEVAADIRPDGTVVIDAFATNGDANALLAELQAIGLQDGAAFGYVVSGRMPLSAISQMTTASNLYYATTSVAISDIGSVTTQDDEALRTDFVRDRFGVSGEGMRAGVLSDSFDCGVFGGLPGTAQPNRYADDIASGDMPAGVDIRSDIPCGIDEGRGMANLMYDLAPDLEFSFHTAFNGQASFAANIVDLATPQSAGGAGADVVVDDIRYYTEPFFQDGVIAQGVDIAVFNLGVPYFASAGNQSDQSYESPFVDSGLTLAEAAAQYDAANGTTSVIPASQEDVILHNFDTSGGVDVFNTYAGTGLFSFQWIDSYFSASGVGAENDLDIYIFTPTAGFLNLSFLYDNQIGLDPIEFFSGGAAGAELAFGYSSGTGFPELIKAVWSSNALFEYRNGGGTGFGHSNARGANATGAAFWGNTPAFGQNPPLLENFSSRGAVPIFFDLAGNRLAQPELRDNPQFTASQGGNTTFFFSDSAQDADSLPNFFGTSAAAPNAATVAILMLEANPSLTPLEVRQLLRDSAIDITSIETGFALPVGYDVWSGEGLIQANTAVALTLSSPSLFCDGQAATIYVEDGIIYKKRNQSFIQAGLYQGVLQGTSNNDVIVGTNVNDRIVADNSQDVICGFDGDDDIRAGGGDDRVFAGNGDDTVRAGSGQDYVEGGEGNDTIFGERGDDRLYGQAGSDFVNGGDNQDRLFGGEDGDILSGERGDDRMDGGAGDDSCDGGRNNDQATACEVINNVP